MDGGREKGLSRLLFLYLALRNDRALLRRDGRPRYELDWGAVDAPGSRAPAFRGWTVSAHVQSVAARPAALIAALPDSQPSSASADMSRSPTRRPRAPKARRTGEPSCKARALPALGYR